MMITFNNFRIISVTILSLSLIVPIGAQNTQSKAEIPDLNFWREERVAALANPTNSAENNNRDRILTEAAEILEKKELYSVTFNERTPPSGDIRDYYSTGPYWWPNPDTPDGLPYVRRDGEFNPERDRVSDRAPLHAMIHDVQIMALAYVATGDAAFAEHGEALLNTWFVDAETGMRPNLNHAQAIPGKTDGRGTGIIDSHPFVELGDAIILLSSWPDADKELHQKLHTWFTSFAQWLQTHPNAADESAAKNNHGTAFDLQLAGIFAYLGEDEALAELLNKTTKGRIKSQITDDGKQPYELKRTRTWSYCTENLEHFFKLARLGEEVDIDLYHYEAENGATLREALEYVIPAACDHEKWQHEQATEWQDEFIRNIVAIIGDKYEAINQANTDCLWDDSVDPLALMLRPVN